MSKLKLSVLLVLPSLLIGCAHPKYTSNPIPESIDTNELTIIEDEATRAIFLDTIQDWCMSSGRSCKVTEDQSQPKEDELTLKYVSRWSWDFKTFMADAKISAYKNKQIVGNVSFDAPNASNFTKYGDASERIKAMLNVLFGELSDSEANQLIKDGEL